ncbi:MAG: nitroreductase family protein [Thermodesulfobacteriota bacterium]
MFLENHRLSHLPPAEFPRLTVLEDKCSGCGRCVQSCPIQLLTVENGKMRDNRRYDWFRCIACENCVAVCPQQAIRIDGGYRVPAGYWKNDHLFSGGKVRPKPVAIQNGGEFEAFETELTETEKIIYRRRSVRLYKRTQVPKDLVTRILEAGRFAPSAGNNQPWKFIVIQNRALIDEMDWKIKQFCRIVMLGTMPLPWVKGKESPDRHARPAFWQKALYQLLLRVRGPNELDQRALGGINAIVADPGYHTFFHAPTVILLLADRRGIGSVDLDTGICGQNIVLAAHALGLGTCYVSLIDGLQAFPIFKRKIGVRPPFHIVTSLTLGYPLGQVDRVVEREQLRVEWID